jgi:hypothetical protein
MRRNRAVGETIRSPIAGVRTVIGLERGCRFQSWHPRSLYYAYGKMYELKKGLSRKSQRSLKATGRLSYRTPDE